MMAQLNPANEALWKTQLATKGYATCTNPACRLCFLSLAGMMAHHKNCPGWIREGDFVPCNFCDMRFKQFRSCQTHVEKLHRNLFNREERESDIEAIEPRPSPLGARAQPSFPPDVVPRQDGSIPAQSPPALQQAPHRGSGGGGKLVMIASPRLLGSPRLITPAHRRSPATPKFSLRASSPQSGAIFSRAPSTALASSSSSNLDEIERKLKERERELEAAEARVRETEEHARRLRELQEKEAVLKEREEMLARREEEAKKQVAAVAAGSPRLQPCPAPTFPRRPIFLPSSVRLPDTARRIHLPIGQSLQGEEIPMDLSSPSVHLTSSRKSQQSKQEGILKPLAVALPDNPGQASTRELKNDSLKEDEETKSCSSPILERVTSPRATSSQDVPLVQAEILVADKQQVPTAQPPLVDLSSANVTEMVGVSALVSPGSPSSPAPASSQSEAIETRAPSSGPTKSTPMEVDTTRSPPDNLTTEQPQFKLHSKSQDIMSPDEGEGKANVTVPLTSVLPGEPRLSEGSVLGLDEMLKNGEVLTLLATEEEDGSITLVSPPISNNESDQGNQDSQDTTDLDLKQFSEPVEVQELEEELKVLKSQVSDILKGGEDDFLGTKDSPSAASLAMVELCRESSLDTLEKRIESPRHGADLVEDFSNRLEALERNQMDLIGDKTENSNECVDEEQAGTLPDVLDELYSSPGEVAPEPDQGALSEQDGDKKSEFIDMGELHDDANKDQMKAVCDLDPAPKDIPNKVVKKKLDLVKTSKFPLKRRISPRRSTPNQPKRRRTADDDIYPVSQSERRSSRLKSRVAEDAETTRIEDKAKKIADLIDLRNVHKPPSLRNLSNSICDNKTSGSTAFHTEVPKSPKKISSKTQSLQCSSAKSKLGIDSITKKSTSQLQLSPPASTNASLKQDTNATNATTQTIKCGSCPATSQSEAGWRQHCARKHAGLARPRGKSQIFTNEEEEVAVFQAFQTCQKIQCPKCKHKSFSQPEGPLLLQHYRHCGELEVPKVVVKHEEEVTTPGGRSRRAAATKAKQRVAEFVEAITGKSNLDGGESDGDADHKDVELSDADDSDDNYDIGKEIGATTLYKFIIESGKSSWRCTVCNQDFPDKAAVEGHVFTKHQAEVDEQDTETEVDESEEENESDYGEVDSDDSYSRPKAKQGRKRRRSGERGAVNLRRPILEPCPQVMHDEAAFRAEAYSSLVLPDLTWDHQRKPVEENNNNFLPKETSSPKFTVSLGGQEVEGRLARFEGALIGNSPMLNAGGPVWGLAWAPMPPDQEQVLAVASSLNHECSTVGGAGEANGLVQIWRCGKQPEFQLGFGHTYGRVWEVAWCPSGGWTGDRLGLLAAACGDGTVRVWVVPKGGGGRAYTGDADLTLTCGDAGGHCLGLSWHRGLGHRHIAACFSSGIVAVWDLATSSSLLLTSPYTLLPYHTWTAHQGSANGISLSPSTDTVPRHLVTGGTDRHYRFWDLRDTSVPVQEVKRGLVTGVSWLPGWAAATVCYDDVYLQAHTQTLVAETGFTGTRSQPVIAQNSGVWGLATSQWLGAMAVGTAAGELIVFVLPASDRSMEHDKNVCQRRSYVYRTQFLIEGKAEEEVGRDFASAQEKATLRYIDLPTIKPGGGDCPLEETKKVRSAERMDLEDLSHYPLAMVNRVSWNQNLGHHLKMASGGQAGLVRIHSLAALNTEEVQTAVAEVKSREMQASC